MPKNGCSTYVMGATEHERRRLLLQGSILNSLTERFLGQAGLSTGMRVLDLGCGIGDVSLIAARIVGPRGSVTGLDPDGAALDTARARANQEGLAQVTFEQTAFETYTTDCLYDAVLGRHVLIHSPDPLGWIRKTTFLLGSGGIAAFQEYDLSHFPRVEPELPLFHGLSDWLVQLFRRAVAYPDVGARLYHWMKLAGFLHYAVQSRVSDERRGGIAVLRVVRRNNSKCCATPRSARLYRRCGTRLANSGGPAK